VTPGAQQRQGPPLTQRLSRRRQCKVSSVCSVRGTHHNDHAHCNGEQSCGKCIRGFVCKRCNLARGQIDALVAELGAARVITLINEGPIP
jgi:hypothetical protein